MIPMVFGDFGGFGDSGTPRNTNYSIGLHKIHGFWRFPGVAWGRISTGFHDAHVFL